MKKYDYKICRSKKKMIISIFIVEDDVFILRLYEIFLRSYGFSVIGKAKNGDEAVNSYKLMNTKPDLIIMDNRMPIKNGIEALKEILEIDKQAKIMIVSADNSIENIAKSVGAVAFMEKPFSMKRLLENINDVLNICV
jgi:two-component system chemotaxis response regulator CheY